MKRLLFIATLLVAALTARGQQPWEQLKYPEAGNFNTPKVETFQLKNGITFFLVEDHELPLVELSAVVRVGSVNDPAGKVGLASMVGSLIREGGSAKYPADELNTLLENRAVEMGSGISTTSGSVFMSALKNDFAEMLPVFYDVLLNPAFPQDKFERVAKQTKSAISRRNDNSGGIAEREFLALTYGKDSPYARYSEYADIDAITREDLVAFHKAHFTGKNLWIGVVGDFDTKTMKKLLTDTFSGFTVGTPVTLNLPKVDYQYQATINFVNKPDVTQSEIRLGHIGGRRQNKDYAALQLFNSILSDGFSGRLLQNVRTELGLAYGVGGQFQMLPLYDGRFFVSAATKSSSTAQAIDAILANIVRLQQEPVSEAELAAAKDRTLNSLAFRYPDNASVLNEQMTNTYVGLPLDAFDQYIAELRKVTVADIQRVAKQYLKPDQMHILVVGNKAEIGDQLTKFGTVNEIDVTIPTPKAEMGAAPKGDTQKGQAYFAKAQKAYNPNGVAITSVRIKANTVLYNEQLPGGKADAKTVQRTDFTNRSATATLELPAFGVTQELAVSGGTGTVKMGGQERPLPPAQVQEMEASFDSYFLNMHTNKGLVVSYLGSETLKDQKAEVLLFTLGERQVKWYLDPSTWLPIAQEETSFSEQAGENVTEVDFFADWREVSEGVKHPFSQRTEENGKTSQDRTATEVAINSPE